MKRFSRSIFALGFVDSANRLDWLFNYSRIQTSGSRIGSTFNGQYLGRSPILFVGLLTYSVNIELNWVSWEARQACIPLIMKVIELHRTTPAITRLNGICRRRKGTKRKSLKTFSKRLFPQLNFLKFLVKCFEFFQHL